MCVHTVWINARGIVSVGPCGSFLRILVPCSPRFLDLMIVLYNCKLILNLSWRLAPQSWCFHVCILLWSRVQGGQGPANSGTGQDRGEDTGRSNKTVSITTCYATLSKPRSDKTVIHEYHHVLRSTLEAMIWQDSDPSWVSLCVEMNKLFMI